MLINPLAPTEKIVEFTTVIYTNLGNPVAIGKHKELRGGWSDPLSLKKKEIGGPPISDPPLKGGAVGNRRNP